MRSVNSSMNSSMNTLSYANEYMAFMKEVHNNNHVLNVSTITLICNLNVDKICMSAFCDKFDEPGIEIKRCKPNKEYELTKRGKLKKSFFNQVTLNYVDISKKSIKVFSNGKLQLTGLTSCLECNRVSNMVIGWLNKYIKDSEIVITNMYMGMINSNFSVMKNLDLIRLNAILNKHDNVMSVYNPESYPAINMKYVDQAKDIAVSVFIFGTGNIVITGGKRLGHMRDAYSFIHKTIDSNKSTVHKTNEHIPKIVKSETHIHGYPIRQYMSCTYT